MKRWMIFVLVLAAGSMSAKEVFALGSDFTKNQLATFGEHCVHGFWVNGDTVTYYAGDTAQLNRDLQNCVGGQCKSRKVVIHVGTNRAKSPWDTKPRDIFADWSVNTTDDPADEAAPRIRMQIDIWLGSKIKLEDLRIPKGFEVVSGGEVEKFIQDRKQKSK
jgi:hypothetical protein